MAFPKPGVMDDAAVVSEAVWQEVQPMELKRARPLLMEVAPPGTVVDGVGGAVRRMKIANFTTSLDVPRLSALKCVVSSGVPLMLAICRQTSDSTFTGQRTFLAKRLIANALLHVVGFTGKNHQ